MTITLSPSQRSKIKEHVPAFRRYLGSPDGREDEEDRLRRIELYASFDRKRLQGLGEADVEQIVGGLWASGIWKNLKYLTDKIFTDNGLEVLREEFASLLTGAERLGARYEKFLRNVKGLGPASITEMLCYTNPRSCGVWNDKARRALDILGFHGIVPVNKYRITGEELEQFVAVLAAIAEELRKEGLGDLDLLQVDFFLYEVWKSSREQMAAPLSVGTEFDHDEIKEKVREIGTWLGFDAETERTIGRGARIDAIWRSAIGNLGVITYVFEVHKSGSIDSLVLNLQKAKANATVQKVVAVSDASQLEKIEQEVQGLPEDFRTALAYWPVDSAARVHQNLSEATEQLRELELVKDLGQMDPRV